MFYFLLISYQGGIREDLSQSKKAYIALEPSEDTILASFHLIITRFENTVGEFLINALQHSEITLLLRLVAAQYCTSCFCYIENIHHFNLHST